MMKPWPSVACVCVCRLLYCVVWCIINVDATQLKATQLKTDNATQRNKRNKREDEMKFRICFLLGSCFKFRIAREPTTAAPPVEKHRDSFRRVSCSIYLHRLQAIVAVVPCTCMDGFGDELHGDGQRGSTGCTHWAPGNAPQRTQGKGRPGSNAS